MKKFLLTLSLCFAAFTAMAQKQYTEKIVVTLDELSFPEATSTLSVTTNDNGTCDFVLPNFLLPSPEPGADPMYVGTIDLKGVKMVKGEKANKISTDTNIEILPGNMEGVMTEQWIGPMLGPVPIKLDGELTDTDMSATIHIAMPNMNIVVVIGEPIQSGIGQVAVQQSANKAVYSLSGVRVANAWSNALPKGIYIVGGKKVVK